MKTLNTNHASITLKLRCTKRRKNLSRIMAISLLVLVGGCATLPEQAKIAAFGNAAGQLGSTVDEIYSSHVNLVNVIGEDDAAFEYMTNTSFSFPPVPQDDVVDRELWNSRIIAAKAVGKYAKQLAAVSEPGASARISKSTENLSLAVIQFRSALSAAESPVASIMPGTLNALVRGGTEAIIARRVRKSIRNAQPYVEALTNALSKDAAILEAQVAGDWEVSTANHKQILQAIRRDRRVNRDELYARYRKSVELHKNREKLIQSYASVGRVLSVFAQAHAELVDSSDDDRALDEFLLFSNQLRPLILEIESR